MAPDISRQAFLRGGLGAVAGVLLGSCAETAGQPSSPDSPDWGALGGSIQGQVTLPSSADYAGAKSLFNSRFDNSTPAAVVTVTSIGDVQQAVAFAANNGVQVAARSGGHSYIGASAANGVMVVDLRELPGGITYDDASGLATIPAAADLDSVQTTLAAQGRLIPSGSCPTVGIAGSTLGGGLRSDARQWGLTCDALASASVVLPSGDAITATPDDNADLYWALRGGGGGNFGVVTSFTLRTFPTPGDGGQFRWRLRQLRRAGQCGVALFRRESVAAQRRSSTVRSGRVDVLRHPAGLMTAAAMARCRRGKIESS